MTRNTILISALIIIMLGVLVYLGTQSSRDEQNTSTTQTRGYSGSIESVSSKDGYIIVQGNTSGTDRAVTKVLISPTTDIRSFMIEKNEEGGIKKQMLESIDVDNLEKGNVVDIEYSSRDGETLDGVTTITIKNYVENLDSYIKNKTNSTASAYLFLKSRLISIDQSTMTIHFNVYNFDTISTTTQSVALTDDVSVYSIPKVSDLSVERARAAASFDQLEPGSDIYFILEKDTFKGNVTSPVGIIIIQK